MRGVPEAGRLWTEEISWIIRSEVARSFALEGNDLSTTEVVYEQTRVVSLIKRMVAVINTLERLQGQVSSTFHIDSCHIYDMIV